MKKGLLRKSLCAAAMLLTIFALTCTAEAAGKTKAKWIHTGGHYYYQNNRGIRVRGTFKTINNKTYFFDKSGIQRTGWRYYRGNYYYFQRKNGRHGYMLKNTIMDGVKLGSDGMAILKSDRAYRKVNVIARATRLVDSLTTEDMNMPEKKQMMFRYVRTSMKVSVTPDLTKYNEDWDVAYAEWMLDHRAGDCYAFGAVYAYILKAIGYEDPMMVASGGHAWAEMKERVYDPNWATVIGPDLTYNVPYNESGTQGRPDWVHNRVYILHVNRAVG